MWRVVANILNKQSRTADKGLSSIFGIGRGAHPKNLTMLQNGYISLGVAGSCECGNEHSGSMKCGEFLE